MPENQSDLERRKRILLISSYLLAGVLFLIAAFYLTSEVYRWPVVFGGAGLVLAFLANRFLGIGDGIGGSRSFLFTTTTVVSAAAIVYALAQVTPAGGSRQFVMFGALGVALGLIGWRFFSDRRPLALGRDVIEETARDRDIRWTRDTLLIWCYAGALGLLLFAIRAVVPAGSPELLFRTLGAGIVLSCSAMLAGVFAGFLFGIPRSPAASAKKDKEAGQPANGEVANANQNGSAQATFEVNTNLEQISDWLTKIIVGLGLIHLKNIPTYLRELSTYFAKSFGDILGAEAITLALIITFGICGFLLGYLFTRLFLTGAFVRALTPEEKFDREIRKAAQSTQGPPSADPNSAEDGAQPHWDANKVAAVAQRVSDAATDLDRGQIRSRVLTLANQYNATRTSMPFTPERTRRLDAISASMRVLYKSAGWMLPELVKSESAGERVAAIAFLQMEPKAEYLEWLAGRFPGDQPFVMYHAAIALQNAANSLPADLRVRVYNAIRVALANVPLSEPNSRKILSDTLDRPAS